MTMAENALRNDIIEVLCNIPVTMEEAGRNSLLGPSLGNISLNRHVTNRRSDLGLIVDQLYHTRLKSGEYALIVFIENVLVHAKGMDLSEKLQQLRHQLENQLETISKQVETINKQAHYRKLYQALLRLNYTEQVELFQDCLGNRFGAFLIYGPPEYGQQWLLNRLIQLVPDSVTPKAHMVSFGRKGRSISIDGFWRELGGVFGLIGSYERQDIIKEIYKCLQNQSVFLIFNDIDRVSEGNVNELLQNLWEPLISSGHLYHPYSLNHYLLMFLVDYNGRSAKWNCGFAEALTIPPSPSVRLPRIKRVPHRVLSAWVDNSLNDFPRNMTLDLNQKTKYILGDRSSEIPDKVIDRICEICGCSWHERRQEWLKY